MTAGDARFVEVYEEFRRHVYGYCRRRTEADRVDDAVSEVFLTVWRRIDQVPDGADCLPWLYGIAFRVLSHQWRSASRKNRLRDRLAGLGAEVFSGPEDYIVMNDESLMVQEALGKLKSTDQEILRLTVWEELEQREVSLALGISLGAVRQRLYEARRNLTLEFNRLERKAVKRPAAQKGGAWWHQKNA